MAATVISAHGLIRLNDFGVYRWLIGRPYVCTIEELGLQAFYIDAFKHTGLDFTLSKMFTLIVIPTLIPIEGFPELSCTSTEHPHTGQNLWVLVLVSNWYSFKVLSPFSTTKWLSEGGDVHR